MDSDIQAGDIDAPADLPDGDEIEGRFERDPEEEARADEFERRCRETALAQFRRLKDDAQAIYGAVKGLPGVRSPQEWANLLEKAGDEIGNGRFIVRCLGAERYLDRETVAVLVTLRQNLVSELLHATAGEVMMIDAAIIGYYNMLRTQRWIGNLSLVVERELFGQEPLNEIHGPTVGNRLEEQLGRLAEVMMPLQDRAARMMMRSLEALRSGPNGEKGRSRGRRGRKRSVLSPAL